MHHLSLQRAEADNASLLVRRSVYIEGWRMAHHVDPVVDAEARVVLDQVLLGHPADQRQSVIQHSKVIAWAGMHTQREA